MAGGEKRSAATACTAGSLCAVCKEVASKYRCSQCAVRYCSVGCYKTHKASKHPEPFQSTPNSTTISTLPGSSSVETSEETTAPASPLERPKKRLRPLTSLSWPPEPDESIFSDPLLKEDAKPLRHVELERIATSPDLRQLLNTTSLPRILRAIDSLPTPGARSAILSRCLAVDEQSLSKPATAPMGGDLLSQRDSPPPLDDLLYALAGKKKEDEPVKAMEEAGFFIDAEHHKSKSSGNRQSGQKWQQKQQQQQQQQQQQGRSANRDRVWIGEEEKRIMRIWAGVVCKAIDGGEGDTWGGGELSWEA